METQLVQPKVIDDDQQIVPSKGMLEVAMTRAAQEVQAAMVIAKRFPRDQDIAFQRIIIACKRKGLAEQAMYVFPRGNTTVTGPSIRLAEELARDWGNIDAGIIEMERKQGESVMMAYAWDLETNRRSTRTFSVRHVRNTKRGNYALTDERDIYEMTANQGARRLRACILDIIPGDITEEAIKQCELTLAGDVKEPLQDRLRKMVIAFSDLGVTKDMLEKRLGHTLAAIIETELVGLRKIYQSITDNMADRSIFFDLPQTDQQAQTGTAGLADRLKQKKENIPESQSDPLPMTTVLPPEPVKTEEEVRQAIWSTLCLLTDGDEEEAGIKLKVNYSCLNLTKFSGEKLDALLKKIQVDLQAKKLEL